MSAPLYQNARRPSPSSNVGLVFDKYFASWNDAFLNAPLKAFLDDENMQRFGTEAKADWVQSISDRGKTASPGDAAGRLATLVTKLGGAIWYVVATSRFVTGTGIVNPLDNGFAFHHTLGVPYLTASGLKGAVRNYWTQWHDPKPNDGGEIDCLLGSAQGGVGSVIFFDILPVAPVVLVPEVMTPHYGEWYQHGEVPGDWMSPTPIPFIAAEAGAVFQIAAASRVSGDPKWKETNRDTFKGILEKTLDISGLGAKTAVGYGRFLLFDTEAEARAAADAIVAASRVEWTPPPAGRGSGARHVASPKYKAGDTLPPGTTLTWNADGELFEVRTRASIILAPKIKIPVAYDGMEDEASISQMVELQHIK